MIYFLLFFHWFLHYSLEEFNNRTYVRTEKKSDGRFGQLDLAPIRITKKKKTNKCIHGLLYSTVHARINERRISIHYKRRSIKITENAIPNDIKLNYFLRFVHHIVCARLYGPCSTPHTHLLHRPWIALFVCVMMYVYYCIQQTNHMDNLEPHINT